MFVASRGQSRLDSTAGGVEGQRPQLQPGHGSSSTDADRATTHSRALVNRFRRLMASQRFFSARGLMVGGAQGRLRPSSSVPGRPGERSQRRLHRHALSPLGDAFGAGGLTDASRPAPDQAVPPACWRGQTSCAENRRRQSAGRRGSFVGDKAGAAVTKLARR